MGESQREKQRKKVKKGLRMTAVCVLAACVLGACTRKPEKEEAAGSGTESVKEAGQASASEGKDVFGQGIAELEQQTEDDSETEAADPTEESSDKAEAEDSEQTAAYTQAYQDGAINLQAEIRLHAKGDELYRFDEDLQLVFVKEELDLEPEDIEKVLGQLEEVFQEMFLDEYKDVGGMNCEFERRGEEFYLSIHCDITEETAKEIADTGVLEVDEAESLRSFEAVCRALEEQGYTKTE